jgi:hypothetical protein
MGDAVITELDTHLLKQVEQVTRFAWESPLGTIRIPDFRIKDAVDALLCLFRQLLI